MTFVLSEIGYARFTAKNKAEHLELEIAVRKKEEEALRKSEKNSAALFHGAAEGILVTDIETKKFIFANPSICRMLGYTEEELRKLGPSSIPDSNVCSCPDIRLMSLLIGTCLMKVSTLSRNHFKKTNLPSKCTKYWTKNKEA